MSTRETYNSLKLIYRAIITAVISCIVVAQVSAQTIHASDELIRLRGLEISNKIIDHNSRIDNDRFISNQTIYDQVIAAILSDNRHEVDRLLTSEMSAKDPYQKHFDAYLQLVGKPMDQIKSDRKYVSLEKGLKSNSWNERYTSALILSVLSAHMQNMVDVIEYTEIALDQIPTTEKYEYVSEKFYAHYMMKFSFVYNVDILNAMDQLQILLDLAKIENRSISPHTWVNNLATVHDKNGNPEQALELTALLFSDLEQQSKYNKFVTNMSHGRFLLAAKKFEEALPYLEKAIALNENPKYAAVLHFDKANAHAHLGEVSEARKSMNAVNGIDPANYAERNLDETKALISASTGDYETAFDLLASHTEKQINFYRDGLSKDRREANQRVLMSKEIAERKVTETELKNQLAREKLEKQRSRTSLYLMLLLTALAVGIGSIFVARKLARLNQKLLRANTEVKAKSKTKSQLLSMFSHEMLTPLNGITPLAEMLNRTETDPGRRSLLQIIELNGHELGRKINDIILVANPHQQVNKPELENSSEFLRDMLAHFTEQQKSGVSLNVQMDSDAPEFMSFDRSRITAVLSAIIGNAFKYTNEGSVTLSLLLDESGRPNFVVEDTGIGFPLDRLEELTKPFNQTSLSISRAHQGIGLGLTVARLQCDIIEADFAVSSEEGKGTQVRIVLPMSVLDCEAPKEVNQQASAQKAPTQQAA